MDSYRCTAGLIAVPDWLLSCFVKRRTQAIEKCRVFVAEGKGHPVPWQYLKSQTFLGDETFVEKMQL